MTDAHHPWSPDWPDQVESKARALGFANLTELLAGMPARPYGEVANRLGVVPMQVLAVQYREAGLTGRIRDAAKDSLARNLVQKLPNGWGMGEDADWQAVHALSSWSSGIQVTGGRPDLRPMLLRIANALRTLPPPQGWVPCGPSDPIIEYVFESEWPR